MSERRRSGLIRQFNGVILNSALDGVKLKLIYSFRIYYNDLSEVFQCYCFEYLVQNTKAEH